MIAAEEDAQGPVWFATAGENLKWWGETMHEKEVRHSFWWRSGLWIVGVDAPEESMLAPIAEDAQAHLTAGAQ